MYLDFIIPIYLHFSYISDNGLQLACKSERANTQSQRESASLDRILSQEGRLYNIATLGSLARRDDKYHLRRWTNSLADTQVKDDLSCIQIDWY
jgi:hypothetical protein